MPTIAAKYQFQPNVSYIENILRGTGDPHCVFIEAQKASFQESSFFSPNRLPIDNIKSLHKHILLKSY